MADTEDLKSSGSQGPCGFESRPRHRQTSEVTHIGICFLESAVAGVELPAVSEAQIKDTANEYPALRHTITPVQAVASIAVSADKSPRY